MCSNPMSAECGAKFPRLSCRSTTTNGKRVHLLCFSINDQRHFSFVIAVAFVNVLIGLFLVLIGLFLVLIDLFLVVTDAFGLQGLVVNFREPELSPVTRDVPRSVFADNERGWYINTYLRQTQ